MTNVPGPNRFVTPRLIWSPDETDVDPVAVRLPGRLRARLAKVCRVLAVAKRVPTPRGGKPPVQVLWQGMTQDARPRSLISWINLLEKAVDRQSTANTQRPGRVANS